MGFASKLIAPKASTVSTPPPVVADTADTDAAAAYEQKASRRRGLLSTILSDRNRENTVPQSGENTTLG